MHVKEGDFSRLPGRTSLALTATAMPLISQVFLSCRHVPFTKTLKRSLGWPASNTKRREHGTHCGILELIGDTPLVRIDSLSRETGCEVKDPLEWHMG